MNLTYLCYGETKVENRSLMVKYFSQTAGKVVQELLRKNGVGKNRQQATLLQWIDILQFQLYCDIAIPLVLIKRIGCLNFFSFGKQFAFSAEVEADCIK